MESIELEESTGLVPVVDDRPRMEELPPVRLVSVEDVHRPTLPELEAALDRFYGGLWQFHCEGSGVYRAENFRLRFTVIADQKPIDRDSVRPLGIIVDSLRDAERKLADAEIAYDRQRGLLPGQYSLLVQDPAGNWVELLENASVK